jgi:hypothetical protein
MDATRRLLEGPRRPDGRQLAGAAASVAVAVACQLLPPGAWSSPGSAAISNVEPHVLATLAAGPFIGVAAVLVRFRSRAAWAAIAILAGTWIVAVIEAAGRQNRVDPLCLLTAGLVAVILISVIDLLRTSRLDPR